MMNPVVIPAIIFGTYALVFGIYVISSKPEDDHSTIVFLTAAISAAFAFVSGVVLLSLLAHA
jgi:hypothetical protein